MNPSTCPRCGKPLAATGDCPACLATMPAPEGQPGRLGLQVLIGAGGGLIEGVVAAGFATVSCMGAVLKLPQRQRGGESRPSRDGTRPTPPSSDPPD